MLISCGDTFCTSCLERLVAASEQKTRIVCPTCNVECGILEGDVTCLPINVLVQRLVRDHQRAQREAEERGRSVGKCAIHPDVDGQYYCSACEQITCAPCAHPGGAHYGQDHHAVSIEEGLQHVADDYKRMLEAVRQSTTGTLDAVGSREALAKRIEGAALHTVANVNGHINTIVHDLERVRIELTSKVHRGAQIVLIGASKAVYLNSRVKTARHASRFSAAKSRFVQGATLAQLLKPKLKVQEECDRLVNTASQQRIALSHVGREIDIGTLVDNRFVNQLMALKKGARTFLTGEMEVDPPMYVSSLLMGSVLRFLFQFLRCIVET
jgi:hypothetical protein